MRACVGINICTSYSIGISMKPTIKDLVYKEDFSANTEGVFESLLKDTPWINKGGAPRDECFMSLDPSKTYSYNSGPAKREYSPSWMSFEVLSLMEKLNNELKLKFNVCVLNYYKSEKEWLGWHADDSPEQDLNHPIAVISFGAIREIWVKPFSLKGLVPEENKFRLKPGSLFLMPGGFQDEHVHKIPKPGHKCGPRISLTYRYIP